MAGCAKHHVMGCDSDPGIRLQTVNRVVGKRVRAMRSEKRSQRCLHIAHPSRRKFSEKISECRVHVGFVERDPVGAEIAKLRNRAFGEETEVFRAFMRSECS